MGRGTGAYSFIAVASSHDVRHDSRVGRVARVALCHRPFKKNTRPICTPRFGTGGGHAVVRGRVRECVRACVRARCLGQSPVASDPTRRQRQSSDSCRGSMGAGWLCAEGRALHGLLSPPTPSTMPPSFFITSNPGGRGPSYTALSEFDVCARSWAGAAGRHKSATPQSTQQVSVSGHK